MDVIVCVKHVPDTSEAEIRIDESRKGIVTAGLVFDINEWDDYALEEAIQLKEKYRGTVTAITVGSEESDRTLRKCLARGADQAIRLTDPKFTGSDGYAIAKILNSVIKDLPFDVILTGALASDDGFAMVGPILAELLGINSATLVKNIEVDPEVIRVNRELEGGLEAIVEVTLPALLTVQTGINEPRYVSIMGIRRAMKKEIKILSSSDIDLPDCEMGEEGSWITIEEIFLPPVEKQAVFLEGNPEIVATKIVDILNSKGLT